MAETIKLLKIKRGNVKGTLTRINTYLKEVTAENFVISEVKGRKLKIEEAWQQFDDIQTQIQMLDDAADHDEERANFEETYYTLLSVAEELIAKYNQKSVVTINNHNAGTSSSSQHSQTQVRLPKINLPSFSGAYDQWCSFFQLFRSLVHNNDKISEVEKLHYLMGSLKGEAANVIQALEITDSNYDVAWDMLKRRYDNKRLIVKDHIKAIFELPIVFKENNSNLRQLLDGVVKHMLALKSLSRPTEHWDDLIIHLITTKLDHNTNKEWEHTLGKADLPKFQELVDFLEHKCETLDSVAKRAKVPPVTQQYNNQPRFNKLMSHVLVKNIACLCCKENHYLSNCETFGKMSMQEKLDLVKLHRVCMNCLRSSNYQAYECRAYNCKKCRRRHHTLLHQNSFIAPLNNSPSTDNAASTNRVAETIPSKEPVVLVTHSYQPNEVAQIMLSTAVVRIFDISGNSHKCRVLLDSGSQSHFIAANLVKKLGVPIMKINTPIIGINQAAAHITKAVEIMIKSHHSNFQEKIRCLVLDKITDNLPIVSLAPSQIPIPKNICLADPEFHKSNEIQMLIGAELFWSLLCVGQIKMSDDQPYFQKTQLGWIVAGKLTTRQSTCRPVSCNLAIGEKLEETLEKFWKIEEIPSKRVFTAEENACESHFINTFTRKLSGRFNVKLPIKNEQLQQLGETREMALRRFLTLERKLSRNEDLKIEYTKFMSEYLKLGHMKLIENDKLSFDESPTFYLPHHAVLKNTSSTTKLRVVFDASAKSTSGISLNDGLMVGPVLQQDLFSIIVRFRTFKYVLTADIEKMYRQVLVDNAETKLQRILWRNDCEQPINTYELKTVTYGTAPASFLAIRCLRQLACEEADNFPTGSRITLRDFYVDDLLTGGNSLEETVTIRNETIALLSKAGFHLRKWSSNCPKLLENISEVSNGTTILTKAESESVRTLGLEWCAQNDILRFSTNPIFQKTRISKRHILSQTARIFDPLGIIGPVVVKAKIIMQRLWNMKVSWDESVPLEMHSQWLEYERELQTLSKIKVNRCVIPLNNPTRIDAHGFCDASERAYGACIYLRAYSEGTYSVNLLCAKSRVAPLKTLTLPRLELCGALLLVRLMKQVLSAITVPIDNINYWTDSTIVLNWVKATSRTWNTFVANRVSAIQDSSNLADWNYVKTSENPADIISRGLCPDQLQECTLWWQGPAWLKEEETAWCSNQAISVNDENIPERRKIRITCTAKLHDVEIFKKYSSLTKLTRVVAYCLRFANNCAKGKVKLSGQLQPKEMQNATKILVKTVQEFEFKDELISLRKDQSVDKNSKLLNLTPFLDEDSVIRVGGRLKNCGISYTAKHQIVLPANHPFATLIIRHEHQRTLHGGVHATLNAVRAKFWPLSCLNAVKRLIRSCVKCFRAKPVPVRHTMGNLPSTRIQPARPFLNCGVDYCGPFYIKESKRRTSKVLKSYGAIFVCFSTKAVHIELVSDLSTEAFIAALKRFIGRRGMVANIYSDNGTNFVGAERELQRLRNLVLNEEGNAKIVNFLTNDNIKWHFNPPNSPHFGGLWEAAVKATKTHLRRIAGQSHLTFEEMQTLLIQIEAVLNSRPLIPLSSDPNDLSCLTPGHFLIGDLLTSPLVPAIASVPTNRLSQYQRIEQLRQHFWTRWSKEYLHRLQEKTKWKIGRGTQLRPGQMVIVRDDNLPPLLWMTGRIQDTIPGKDGVVRTAVVKTTRGLITRAAARLCILPFEENSGSA